MEPVPPRLTQKVLVSPCSVPTWRRPRPAPQMSTSYVGRQTEQVSYSGVGAGVLYLLGGWGMGMRLGKASLMKTSRRACWRRWRLEMGLDEEGPIPFGGSIHPCCPLTPTLN